MTHTPIKFGLFDTPLGAALLAATPRGLCALRLCVSHGPQEQLADVRRDMPQATLEEEPRVSQGYADQLIAFLEARAETFNPPLDIISGTAFQREVWAELQNVPPGERITYTDLAARVGRPLAVRAVASACARNGLAIAIPCHRAVRRDGTLAGFRWGVDWKQRLLASEAGMKQDL